MRAVLRNQLRQVLSSSAVTGAGGASKCAPGVTPCKAEAHLIPGRTLSMARRDSAAMRATTADFLLGLPGRVLARAVPAPAFSREARHGA